MKKLMILGAGIYQVPLIKKAKEMGLFTVVTSIPGPYPGFQYADEALYLNTTDAEGILAAAEERQIDGILTTGTDVAMHSVGLVCETLGLPGISLSASEILTDKAEMKKAFKAGGVRTAEFKKVLSLAEAERAAEEIGYPVMVKVTDKSGSRGVTKVSGPEELEAAYSYAMSFTGRDYLVVEKFIEGHEIGIDAFVSGGKPVLLLPHDKLVYRGPHSTVPVGHVFPYAASEALKKDIETQVQRIIDASGLDNAALNIDAFVSGDELYVIEAGGRCGATCIPELISLYGGIDYYGLMIRAALGETTDFRLKNEIPCAASLLFTERSAKLVGFDGEKIEALEKDGYFISFDYREGDELPAMENGTDRIGQVYGPCSSEKDIEEMVKRARACIACEYAPAVL